jgi:glycosyltransferase involved in cell wall biosynthesis
VHSVEGLFWFSFFILLYTVALYPLLLLLIGLFIRDERVRDDTIRKIAVIIPVYNGENEIEGKIKNCLDMDYPEDMLEIYVVSDGSTDKTVEIVDTYRQQGIHCLPLMESMGKVAAQNQILPRINAEIIVFTDVGIIVPPSALKDIVSNFADDSIGAVSCRDEIITQFESYGDSLYINYDMVIRSFTSKVGSLIGVTGGFYAVRRELAEGGWDPAFPPDFYVALKSLKMGFRVVEDSRVTARYYTPASDTMEMERKIRTITRGMAAFFSNMGLLNVFKYPMVSLQLVSHKLLRWAAPLFFIICFVSSGALAYRNLLFYQIIFGIMAFFLCIGTLGVFFGSITGLLGRLFLLPRVFIVFNLAIVISWKNLLTGKRIVKWTPTVRKGK